MTFAGLVMLLRVCQPLNVYRFLLFVLMVGLTAMALSVPFLGDMLYKVSDTVKWSTLHWDSTKLLILAVTVEAAFPISNGLIKLMQILMPSSTGKKPDVLDIRRNF